MIRFDPETLTDPRALRTAFGAFMTGVTVVTAQDTRGMPVGFTANSFASVSLDPPLVLVCLANTSSNFDVFANTEKFAINVLSETQIDVSNTFARPVEDRFASVGWQDGPHGSPILDDVSAWFDCAMHQTIDAGDHLILIGEVKGFDHNVAPGLGYARGAYVTPAAEAEALGKRSNMVVSALIERDGKVLLLDNAQGRLTLPMTNDLSSGTGAALKQLISDTGASAEPGFIYSVYEDKARQHQHISFLCKASDGPPSKGVFTELTESTLMGVADPAMCTMLERFAEESRLGNFGVYYGNEVIGEVKPVADGSR
ncbi:flavin reductase [Shimia sp. NS0008-38b]|uniref:flavin reductase n=1 Tax=Shimia sp. NS0008-38b TaxID=3127653 RepID=UPI00310ADBFE